MEKRRIIETIDDDYHIDDDVFAPDDNELREHHAIQHKTNIKRRRRKIKAFRTLIILVLLCIYLLSGLSDIKALNVSGNVIYSQNEILKMIGLNYHEKSILYPSFYLEYKLKKNDLIKSCKVTKTFGGGVYIHVVEQSIVGYYYEGKVPYVLLSSGDKVKMDVDNINLITSPYINGLNDEQRQKLCRYIKKLDNSDMKLISEIRHYSSSYDNDMLELIMVDGHKVHTSYSGLKLMNSYRDILKGLNSTLQCIEIVEETNSAYSQNCK